MKELLFHVLEDIVRNGNCIGNGNAFHHQQGLNKELAFRVLATNVFFGDVITLTDHWPRAVGERIEIVIGPFVQSRV